jgi:hypothetical protein
MWPTWANIIGYDNKAPYYNYADAGMGNVGIAHRVLEADLKHTFTENDDIYIMWTSWTREDRIKEDYWNSCGSVLNPDNIEYPRYFAKRYWNMNNDIVKNSHAIISTNKMYKNNITWQGAGFPFFVDDDFNLKLKDRNKQIIKLYEKQMPKLEVLELENPPKLAFGHINDLHPDISRHLEIAKHIYSVIGKELKPETIDYFQQAQNFLETISKINKLTELDQLAKYMPNFFGKFKEMIPMTNQVPLAKYLPDAH